MHKTPSHESGLPTWTLDPGAEPSSAVGILSSWDVEQHPPASGSRLRPPHVVTTQTVQTLPSIPSAREAMMVPQGTDQACKESRPRRAQGSAPAGWVWESGSGFPGLARPWIRALGRSCRSAPPTRPSQLSVASFPQEKPAGAPDRFSFFQKVTASEEENQNNIPGSQLRKRLEIAS